MSFSKVDLDNLLNLINKGDISTLKSEDFDQFQYVGFDPMKIVQELLKVKKEQNIDDTTFRHDVYKMIAVGIIKGSVSDKNMTKMSDEGRADINAIISTYGVAKGGGKGKAATVITFPRVMATFPNIAVRMVSVIGPKEFSGGPMLSSRLPDALKIQVFPSIIPRNLPPGAKKMLLMASLCYTIDQSIQISEIKNPDLKQISSIQGKFTMIGHQSPVPSSAVRLDVFNSLSLGDQYSQIVSVLRDYKEKIDPSFDILEESEFKTQVFSMM